MSQRARWRRIAGLGARFLTVGAISTLIEIGVFNLLYLAFGWDPVAAKIVASLVALVNAYFGNREWTFRHRDRRGRTQEIVLFVLVNAACTALGALLVWVGVEAATRAARSRGRPVHRERRQPREHRHRRARALLAVPQRRLPHRAPEGRLTPPRAARPGDRPRPDV